MPVGSQQQPPLRAFPALLIAASFASGIGAAMLLNSTAAALTLAATLALLGLVATLVRKIRSYGLLLIVIATGAADYTFSTEPVTVPAGIHVYSGIVEQSTEGASRQAIVVGIDSIDRQHSRQFRVRLTLEQGINGIEEGERLTFRTTLETLTDSWAMPDVTPYSERMRRAGIEAAAFLVKDNIIEVEEAGTPMAFMMRMRNNAVDIINRSSLSTDSKLFLATALLGKGDSLGSDTREAFARAGLSHILALSGLHLAIIATLFYWFLAPLLLFFSRHIRSVTILIMIWGYAFLTGLGAPVVRAAIMTSLILLADLLQRRTFALNSLMLAALIILLFSPTQLGEIGFQLSFVAVASIISFAEYLNPFATNRNHILRTIGSALGMSSAAMLATGLISALHFHSIPILFLLANIIVGPIFVPLILGGGIVIIVASITGAPYGVAAKIVDYGVELLFSTANFIASIPWSTVEIWTLSGLTVGLVIATLSVIAIRLRRPESSRWLSAGAIALAAITFLSALTTGKSPSRDVPGTRYYLQSSDGCDLLIPINDTIYLISDAPLSTLDSRAESLIRSLKEYMGPRRISTVKAVDGNIAIDGLIRNNSRLLIGKEHIVLAGHRFVPGKDSCSVDLLILGRGFNGDLRTTYDALHPSKVILSPALNPRLHKRYASELRQLGADYDD